MVAPNTAVSRPHVGENYPIIAVISGILLIMNVINYNRCGATVIIHVRA